MKEVYEEGSDVILFLYSTAKEDDVQRMVAGKFNDLAQKFAQMKVKSVKFLSYDVNVEN